MHPYRQGAQFVESWVDGFAFSELAHRQDNTVQQREELERQRKQLTKRKVNPGTTNTTNGMSRLSALIASDESFLTGKGKSSKQNDSESFAKPHVLRYE